MVKEQSIQKRYRRRIQTLQKHSGIDYCIHERCFLRASFGYDGEYPIFCKAHKDPDMVNLKYNALTCYEPNCTTGASYALPGAIEVQYCTEHASPNMVRIHRPRCYEHGCNRDASHNFPHTATRLYCFHHIKDGMVNMSIIPCTVEGCKRKACYRTAAGDVPIKCREHAEEGMVFYRSKNRHICRIHGCDTPSTHCFPIKPIHGYCEAHKTDEMVLQKPLLEFAAVVKPDRPYCRLAGLTFYSKEEFDAFHRKSRDII
jgi:hypothetical protein